VTVLFAVAPLADGTKPKVRTSAITAAANLLTALLLWVKSLKLI
jgi:hypothetical protein